MSANDISKEPAGEIANGDLTPTPDIHHDTDAKSPTVEPFPSFKASDDDFDPLKKATSENVVAVRMPLPNWTVNVVNELRDAYSHHVKLLADIDTIKIRKTLNKNEDDFVQAVITHYLATIDERMKTRLEQQTEIINKLLKNLRHIVSLDMVLSKSEKEKMSKEFNIEKYRWSKGFYVFESDLKSLDEWRMLTSIGNAGSSKASSFYEIAKSRQDDYVVRISKRIYEEFKTALDAYVDGSQVNLETKVEPVEFLGALKHFRRKQIGFLGFEPQGSEGDYWRNGVQSQAYNEDSVRDYAFKSRFSGRLPLELRQRTAKISVEINMLPFHFQEATDLLKQIRTTTTIKGKAKA